MNQITAPSKDQLPAPTNDLPCPIEHLLEVERRTTANALAATVAALLAPHQRRHWPTLVAGAVVETVPAAELLRAVVDGMA